MNTVAIMKFLDEAQRNVWAPYFNKKITIKKVWDEKEYEFFMFIPFWRRYSLFTAELRRRYKDAWKDIYEYLKNWKVFIEQRRGRRLYVKNTLKEVRFYVAWFTGSSLSENANHPRTVYIHYLTPYLSIPDLNHGYYLLDMVCREVVKADLDEMENWAGFDLEPEAPEDADFKALRYYLTSEKLAKKYLYMRGREEVELERGNVHIACGWTGKVYEDYIHYLDGEIAFEWFYQGWTATYGLVEYARGLVSITGKVKTIGPTFKVREKRKGTIRIFDLFNNEEVERVLHALRERYEQGGERE